MRRFLRLVTLALAFSTLSLSTKIHPVDAQQKSKVSHEVRQMIQEVVSIGGLETSKKSLSDEQIISYALTWNALRHYSRFSALSKDGNHIGISSKYVVACSQKMFGRTPKHRNISGWNFRNGYYFGHAELFEQLGLLEIKRLSIIERGPELEATVTYRDEFEPDLQQKRVLLRVIKTGSSKKYFILGAK